LAYAGFRRIDLWPTPEERNRTIRRKGRSEAAG